MRTRERVMVGAGALLIASFLIYSPVVVAWWKRIDGEEYFANEKNIVGGKVISSNRVIEKAPFICVPFLRFQGWLCGFTMTHVEDAFGGEIIMFFAPSDFDSNGSLGDIPWKPLH